MSFQKRVQLTDQYGFVAECTPLDQVRVAENYRLVGSTFVGATLDTNFWTSTVANSGAITQANGMVRVRAVTTNNASAILQSVRFGRYVAANANFYRGILATDNATNNTTTLRWGAFDANNGAFFQFTGGVVSVVTRKTGADTAVASGSWSTGQTMTMDTNVHEYEIYMTNGAVRFTIDGVLVHTVSATTTTWTDTLTLPVRAEAVNVTNIIDSSLYIRVNTITRLGPANTEAIYKNVTGAATTTLKLNAGRLHRIIANSTGGTSVAIYDNTAGSGTLIGTLILGAIGSYEYQCPFFTGLTLVTVGASCDITVIYE